jgi:hypothetical protein
LKEVLKYLDTHPEFFQRLEHAGTTAIQHDASNAPDGKISRDDVLSLLINQQALVADAALARWIVPRKFPNVAFGDKSMDFRLTSNDGLKALARAALSDATTLREQVEVVAFLPESSNGVRNQLITAYYTVVGREKTAWLNPTLKDPLNVQDPMHTGWDWLVIGANASNSVGSTIRGERIIGGTMIPNPPTRNSMADGNQQIFTDVAIRNAALIEKFPTGTAATFDTLSQFLDKAIYVNGKAMFVDGDRQMRDSMFFSLAARESTDPLKRKILSYQSTASTAIHEQAAIQTQLVNLFGQTWSDDGIVGLVANVATAAIGSSPEQLGNKVVGKLQLGADKNSKIVMGLADDVPESTKAKFNPIAKLDLTTTLSPKGIKSVVVGGKAVNLDGSNLELDNITGWAEKGFSIDPVDWKKKRGKPETVIVPTEDGDLLLPGSDGTAADKWTDYDDRLWYIDNLFQGGTFNTNFPEWNAQLSTKRLPTTLAFLPENAKALMKPKKK